MMSNLDINMEELQQIVAQAEAEATQRSFEETARRQALTQAARRRKRKARLVEKALQGFFAGPEGEALRQAMQAIKLERLWISRLPITHLQLKQGGEWEFVRAFWLESPNQYHEIPHSLKAFAELFVNNNDNNSSTPEELVKRVQKAVQQGWDEAFHAYRLQHDPAYKAQAAAKERASQRKWQAGFCLIVIALASLIYYFIR